MSIPACPIDFERDFHMITSNSHHDDYLCEALLRDTILAPYRITWERQCLSTASTESVPWPSEDLSASDVVHSHRIGHMFQLLKDHLDTKLDSNFEDLFDLTIASFLPHSADGAGTRVSAGTMPRSKRKRLPCAPLKPFPASPPDSYPELDTLPRKVSQTVRAISSMPVVRALDLKEGKVLKGLHRGTANLESALGQMRGVPPAAACFRCARGFKEKGPFTTCIVVPGRFNGACCNCRYNDDGSGCNLHCMSP